ncbi:hypothetical protein TEQG_02575 [Trichophyton equinum CBS 127.97]|uniref:Uncharacterized protein n=1 Tax=Trichophyton equinum (strain ATCC MYA-4606 / CBS 127.97) TaxID=559882 RepID=F2PNS7_TRIEC|nr:hypothetical protein TEQG_02575 [Trichophyton equinum CBS 127.97]
MPSDWTDILVPVETVGRSSSEKPESQNRPSSRRFPCPPSRALTGSTAHAGLAGGSAIASHTKNVFKDIVMPRSSNRHRWRPSDAANNLAKCHVGLGKGNIMTRKVVR